MLEKLLRSLPEIKKIFVMIRPQKNVTIQERLFNSVFTSELFTTVFEAHPELRANLFKKVIPIAGDLIKEGLGISQADVAVLSQELDVIINCAASVQFDDPLLDAIQINYFGCLRMLELAKKCVKLQVLVHVSTAYVNSDRPGLVEEKIYELEEDPEEIIANIMKMDPQYISDNEKQLIRGFPNTYTYTKGMAERALKKNAGNIKTAIVRPTAITGCVDEPVPGWTDTLAATGGITISFGIGILHYIRATPECIFDLIPADRVSNLIIGAAYFTASDPLAPTMIIHSGTSEHSPCTIKNFADSVIKYVQYNPYIKQAFNPYVIPLGSENEYKLKFGFYEQLPVKVLQAIAIITGNKKLKN